MSRNIKQPIQQSEAQPPRGTRYLMLGAIGLDVVLTCRGQPPGYWIGYWELAHEANPIGRVALETHPLVFAALMAGWMALLLVVITHGPTAVRMPLASVVTVAHLYGAGCWLFQYVPGGTMEIGAVVGAAGLGLLNTAPERTAAWPRAASAFLAPILILGIGAAACCQTWEPGPYDDAGMAANLQLDRGMRDRAEVLLTMAYVEALRLPTTAPRRWAATTNLALFYNRTGRKDDAVRFARASLALARAANDGKVFAATEQLVAPVLDGATPEPPAG